MDDYDEVDFWGGESPSARQTTSPSLSRAIGPNGHEMAVDDDDEDSEDGEDSEDEIMFGGQGRSEEDEEDEEEDDGPMSLELIGHR